MNCENYSGLIVGLIAVLIGIYSWNANYILSKIPFHIPFLKPEEISNELAVANSWSKLIADSDTRFARVAVGVNGNVDLIVKGTTLLKLLDSASNSSDAKHTDNAYLSSIKDLQETFGYFHERGAGGERYMENYEVFQHVLKNAKSISDAQYFIGGNGALMAQKFASELGDNGQVLIGCPVGTVLKPLLKSTILTTATARVKQDEYHIIMEYEKGEKWDGHVSPIASRFIFSHDINNSKMLSLEGLLASFKMFRPDLLVLSGFHLLESQEQKFRSQRLNEVANLMRPISKSIPIHVELASMSDKMFVKDLADKILSMLDSVGLNEQELWLLCQIGGGPHCSSGFPSGPPPVAEAGDVLTWMMRTYSSDTSSRLTRIHFHTLTYHIVVTRTGSRWRNQVSSVLAGTKVAANQACDDDAAVRPEKFELRINGDIQLTASQASRATPRSAILHSSFPIISWHNDDLTLYLSPVLVCRKPVKTVGLGDAISALGLLYSGFV